MKTRKGKKVYPLTVAQKLHYFTMENCPKKQVLNIGTSLTIEQKLDFDVLREAILKAYERCDSMRIRFAKDKDGIVYQYLADQEEREIEYFDFTGWTQEAADDLLEEWTSKPFKRNDSPMNRVVMITMPDQFEGIYMLVDHMTMDAQSLILYMKDVIEIYCHLKYEGIAQPKEMASYIQQLEKDLAYEAGSRAQIRDMEYYDAAIKESEPIFNDLFGEGLQREREKTGKKTQRAAVYQTDNVEANIAAFHLEADPSHRLLQFCEDNQISMVCLLMMGLRTFYQKQNQQDDVSIMSTVARRATLLEKKSGGTRIHYFPCRTIVTEEDSFLDGLFKIQEAQNTIFRHANYNPVELLMKRAQYYQLEPGQTYEPMSLTYQPLTLKENGLDELGDIKYKTNWYTNGVAAQLMYLTVMHRATDNGLDFNFEYQTGGVDYEQLEYFYYYICRILFKGIEDPYATVKSIMDSI